MGDTNNDTGDNVVRVFSHKVLKRFIQLYKELPCLWDIKSMFYRDKTKRNDAIKQLTSLVQQYEPSATRVHVLRKIETLRSCVRREHKKVVESRRRNKDPEDVYTPTLWYYKLFLFVFGEDDDCAVKADTPKHAMESTEDSEIIIGDDELPFEQHSYTADYASMAEVIENPHVSKRYVPYEEDQGKSSKRICAGIDDEYDAIGINVAAKLRTLPANMRILAEKLINDVLFQAQVNGLTSSTVISTPDPFKEDIK